MKFVIDLEKSMRSHKYVKRTGGPGNYKYWYKLPNGQLVASDDAAAQQHGITHDGAKLEHVKRLLASRMSPRTDLAGLHDMSNKQIAEHVGVPGQKVSTAANNMKRAHRYGSDQGTNWRGRQFQAHDFSDHHLKEAVHHNTNSPEYNDHVGAQHANGLQSHEEAQVQQVAAQRRADRAPAPARAAAPAAAPAPTPARPRRARSSSAPSPQSTQPPRSSNALSEQMAEMGIRPAAASAETPEQKRARLRKELSERHGVNLGGAPAPAAAPAPAPAANVEQDRQRAVEAARRASSPHAPHARELHEAAPDLARDDQHVERAEREQGRGENTYLNRAREFFERVKGELKPERSETVGYMFQALDQMKAQGKEMTEANWIKSYNDLSGRRVRTIPDDFERATFHTPEEVLKNPPVNPEVERMKRGYGAKQFARMKPFLKASFTAQHPSAPPPYPTFGDVKSWTEHGGTKPDWAGSTRLAMPKEVFDAVHKGADGKPKYPPAWMPIHLMPVWNYVAKSVGDDSVYQATPGTGVRSDQSSPTGHKLDLGNKANHQEGMIVSAIRKYVQHRGGAEQLTDIPSSKLAEHGMTHADLFKAKGDKDIMELMKTKIIDPVALMPFIMAEMKSKMKKSFSLVIGADLEPVVFKKSFVVRLSKSEARRQALIEEIKQLRGTL